MKLSITLLLLPAASRAQGTTTTTFDLYARSRYHDANGEPCGSCAESGECQLQWRTFFLRDACFNRGDAKSSLYDELPVDGGGVVCRRDYRSSCEDGGATFDAEDVEDCRDSWTVDECTDEAEVMTRHDSQCVAYPPEYDGADVGPVGEYTVPLLTFREYDDVESCGTSNYKEILLPDEGGACTVTSFIDGDGVHVLGSRRNVCDGDGAFDATRYDSPDCTGPGKRINLSGSSDECPAAEEVVEGSSVYVNDCAAPRIYCKPSSIFGDEVAAGGAGDAAEVGGGSATGDAAGEGSTGGATGMIVGIAAAAAVLVVGGGLYALKKKRGDADGAEREIEGKSFNDLENNGDLLDETSEDDDIPPPPEVDPDVTADMALEEEEMVLEENAAEKSSRGGKWGGGFFGRKKKTDDGNDAAVELDGVEIGDETAEEEQREVADQEELDDEDLDAAPRKKKWGFGKRK